MPLTRRLSHALIAYTLEVDAGFEARVPHRTTDHGGTRGAPWLVSLAMWFNCLAFLDAGGITVAELERRARTPTNVDGMRRWGYVRVEGDIIRPTPAGVNARAEFAASLEEVEARWAERFDLQRLRTALRGRVDAGLPDTLPILGYGLFSRGRVTLAERPEEDSAPLCVLLARVLLAIALLFERRSKVSLAVAANTLRVLDARVADLPRLTGASKEANAMAVGWLERSGLAEIGKDGRLRVARLTPAGVEARAAAQGPAAKIETRIGDDELLAALEPIAGFLPEPAGWRAAAKRADTLPHFPLVLHRGGFPDGA